LTAEDAVNPVGAAEKRRVSASSALCAMIVTMAYDEDLGDRIARALPRREKM
jgi:hypothetical protein